MYIKLIFKVTINNKQMYFPRPYKYRDSYVLYIHNSTHLRDGKLYTVTHDISAPCNNCVHEKMLHGSKTI